MVGLLARRMGGGALAQGLASAAATVSLIAIAYNAVYSMNALDLLLAACAVYLLVVLIDTGDPRWWVVIGLVLGLGLLNKVGMLWIGLGVFVATVLGRERRWLATRWPWIGGALATLFFLPYVLWNATHDWAHLEFIRGAVGSKYSGLDAWDFLSGQFLIQNPVTLPIWLAGLVYLFTPAGKRYRALGILFLTAAVVLVVNGHSKSEYLASAFAGIFAAGGIAWEHWLEPAAGRTPRPIRWHWLRIPLVGLLVLGLALAPLVLPILPVETYIEYAAASESNRRPPRARNSRELPQFYADMFGWEEKAAAVAEVYQALPSEERRGGRDLRRELRPRGRDRLLRPALRPAAGDQLATTTTGSGARASATGEVVIYVGGSEDGPAVGVRILRASRCRALRLLHALREGHPDLGRPRHQAADRTGLAANRPLRVVVEAGAQLEAGDWRAGLG